MQSILANLLLEHQPLADLIGNGIHWDVMVQGQALPNVVMFVISGVTNYTFSGPSGHVMTRVQFDCRGTTAAQARAVALALNTRLSGLRTEYEGIRFQGCFAAGQRTRFAKVDSIEWFTDSRDFNIHWAPA